MNEAWGAVVAAVAAGVFGVGGALVGIYVGRKQTTDQAQVEHEQWLRGERREAYVAYLAAHDAASMGIMDVVLHLPRHIIPASCDETRFDEERNAFFNTAIGEAMEPAHRAVEAVKLLGPTGASLAASKADEKLNELAQTIAFWGISNPVTIGVQAKQAEFMQGISAVARLREEFFEQARQVIAKAPKPGD
ncbi:hypothetical protein [Streptomyces sp. NPDC087859]|uniref:hypothetical protein n=1 Tax=Streptomyces sp. NPDC087859 TaxID=3365812 RepID=UPI00382876AC